MDGWMDGGLDRDRTLVFLTIIHSSNHPTQLPQRQPLDTLSGRAALHKPLHRCGCSRQIRGASWHNWLYSGVHPVVPTGCRCGGRADEVLGRRSVADEVWDEV
jgi:hypothetical protein